MHKNTGRFFALSAIAALTIFAGKTFAESRQQELFTETPVVAQVASHHDASEDVKVQSAVPASAAVLAAGDTSVSTVSQTSVSDVSATTTDSAVAPVAAKHFSIKRGAGDDEDDSADEDGE